MCEGRHSKRRNVLVYGHIAIEALYDSDDMAQVKPALLRLYVQRYASPTSETRAYAKPRFITHAHSRIFPLSLQKKVKAEELTVCRRPGKTPHRAKLQTSERASVSKSVEHKESEEIPKVNYESYRAMHLQRHNSTRPSSRGYSDYGLGRPVSERLYQPLVIRLSSRSRLTLHRQRTSC